MQLLLLFGMLSMLSACIDDNPLYCRDDADCARRNPSLPLCHPLGSFCYVGCSADSDCADRKAPGYAPASSQCNLKTKHCQRPTNGVGKGGFCRPGQCASGLVCVDGTCCGSNCDGPCKSCETGDCTPLAAGTSCGASQCKDNQLTEQRCDAQGNCVANDKTCGGYTCADQSSCRKSCATANDCVSPFRCDDQSCHADLPNGTPCGANNKACKSGFCVDGVCCEKASCDGCYRCNGDTLPGQCTPRPAGPAPSGVCSGDPGCATDRCDGQGGCEYVAAGTACGSSACTGTGPFQAKSDACDGAGACSQTIQKSCVFMRCDDSGATAVCLESCATHSDCINGSVCDRSQAHLRTDGGGYCVNPAEVITVAAGDLEGAVAQTTSSKSYVAIPPGNYQLETNLATTPVRLIGLGNDPAKVIIGPKGASTSTILRVAAAANVLLQGVTISGAPNDAIFCDTNGSITIAESFIGPNQGIGVHANTCALTVRRSTIHRNDAGGLSLIKCTADLVNSLVNNNGTIGSSGSTIGGINLDRSTAVNGVNVTIAFNSNSGKEPAGVICKNSPAALLNSIVWGNIGAGQHGGGCSFEHCTVEQAQPPSGTGNLNLDCTLDASLKPAPTSPCIDAGKAGSALQGSLDLGNASRTRGAAIDIGAFEIN